MTLKQLIDRHGVPLEDVVVYHKHGRVHDAYFVPDFYDFLVVSSTGPYYPGDCLVVCVSDVSPDS